MGNLRLASLPITKNWREVVRVIAFGRSVEHVALATSRAADSVFREVASDPGVGHCYFLLCRLASAGLSDVPVEQLRDLGISAGDAPTPAALVVGYAALADAELSRRGLRTDAAEMSRLAAAEALASALRHQGNLFEKAGVAEGRALKSLSRPGNVGDLARDFFSRLTSKILTFYLSKELSNHVGASRRFKSIQDHEDFRRDLRQHCDESSEIVRIFAKDWYAKHVFKGEITKEGVRGFLGIAIRKIRRELGRRGQIDVV